MTSGFMQPAVGRHVDREAFPGGVVDDLVHELRPQQHLATHQREHAARRRLQPVDRRARDLLGHALHAVVVGPAVVAVEVALQLGEQIRDDRMEVAWEQPRLDVRKRPPAHAW